MARVQIPVTNITPVAATLTTTCSGSDNDLTFTAVAAGPDGNNVRVRYVVSGNNTPLSVVVEGKDITVNVATDSGGSATSTAAQVLTAIGNSVDASALVSAALASANDGTGVVAAFSYTALAGGSWAQTPPAQTAGDATNDHYFTGNDGNVYVEVENDHASSQTVTVHYGPTALPGATVAADTITIPTGETRYVGPFSPSKFNQNQAKDVYLDPSVSTDVKFRALRIVRAT